MTRILIVLENPFQFMIHKKFTSEENWFWSSPSFSTLLSFRCIISCRQPIIKYRILCVPQWPRLLRTHPVLQPRTANGDLGCLNSPWLFNFNYKSFWSSRDLGNMCACARLLENSCNPEEAQVHLLSSPLSCWDHSPGRVLEHVQSTGVVWAGSEIQCWKMMLGKWLLLPLKRKD